MDSLRLSPVLHPTTTIIHATTEILKLLKILIITMVVLLAILLLINIPFAIY